MIEVPGLKHVIDPDAPEKGLQPGNDVLKPYQKEGVEYLARAKRAFLADEGGLGKSVQALGAVRFLDAFPCLIICPASAKGVWRKEIEKWFDGVTYQVLESGEAVLPPQSKRHVCIVSYDVLGEYVVVEPKVGDTGEITSTLHQNSAIVDESHYCKNSSTQRTKATKAATKRCYVVLGLSGTIVENRPAEFGPQLQILKREYDVGGSTGSFGFLQSYCNPRGWGKEAGTNRQTGKPYYDFSAAVNIPQLLAKLKNLRIYLRRRQGDVQKDLPEKRIAIVPLEIDNREDYEAAKANVVRWKMENEGLEAGKRAFDAAALVQVEVLKQLALKGKWAQAREWIGSHLESGEKLVVFTSHIDSIKRLQAEFPGALALGGDVPTKERERIIERFQTDPKVQLIVVNLRTAAVSIDLTAARHVAFLELGWTASVHNQAEWRVHRKGQRHCVFVYYLLAQGTIEEDIYGLIEEKRKMMEAALDGEGQGEARPVAVDALWRLERAARAGRTPPIEIEHQEGRHEGCPAIDRGCLMCVVDAEMASGGA